MLDRIFSIYERNIKYILIVIPALLFIVMAYLYIKSS